MKKHIVTIEGMSCNHCLMAVRKELASIEGIEIEDVSIGTAIVLYDGDKETGQRIADAIRTAGFTLSPVTPNPQ